MKFSRVSSLPLDVYCYARHSLAAAHFMDFLKGMVLDELTGEVDTFLVDSSV